MQVALSQIWYWLVLGVVCSYFLGCFNFAILISHLKKSDIRQVGSGNPGTMNMSRTFGFKVGVINFFCDAFKGFIPVMVGYFAFRNMVFPSGYLVSDFARYCFGISAVIGHIFPVTMKFKGGKGIATTLGLLWAGLSCETWWFGFIVFGIFWLIVLYIALTEWGSMGSLIGVSGFSIWQLVILFNRVATVDGWLIVTLMLILGINLLTWLAHHKNLYMLVAGEEHRTSVRKMFKKKKHQA